MKKQFWHLSEKRLAISREDSRTYGILIVVAIVIAVDIVIAVTALKQINYQSRVITRQKESLSTLEKNNDNAEKLKQEFTAFNTSYESLLGDPDKKNAQLVLDALPSKYDFPALQTTLELMIKNAGLSIVSINGTDQEATAEQESIQPAPVAMPVDLIVEGTYENIQKLLKDFERSIRPMNIREIIFSGSNNVMQASIKLETYYQPSKLFDLKTETIR